MSIAGRYTLIRPQSDRGLGEAWVAESAERTRRLLKLHPLSPDQERSTDAVVANLRRVDAPGVAAVRDAGVWEGWLFLAYEPCGGRSLWDWLEGWRTTRTSPTTGTAQVLFKHLCSVLHAVHAKAHSHGHLSPRSVIVAAPKAPQPLVVFDWSLGPLIAPGDLTVCANYVSPEQADRPASADPKRADLFALGVMLAELLTLRATPGANSRETWEQWLRARPRRDFASVGPRPEDAPEAVWKLVERMLLRRDEGAMNATALRQAAKEAWGSAHEEVTAVLREAPTPLAPVVPVSPRREGRSAEEPLRPAALPAEAIDVRDGVARALRSVPVPSSRPPPEQSPLLGVRAPDPGGDTLVEEEGLWSRPPEAVAPVLADNQRTALTSPSAVGSDTLPLEYTTSYFDEPEVGAAERAPFGFGDPAAVAAIESPYGSSDAFAHSGRSYDTLPLDDPSSGLTREALRRGSIPVDQTLPLSSSLRGRESSPSDDQTATFVRSSHPPGAFSPVVVGQHAAPGDTLPVGVDALPRSPRSIAPVVGPTLAVRPVSEAPPRPSSAPRTQVPEPRSWQVVAVVLGAGVLLGLIVAWLLKLV